VRAKLAKCFFCSGGCRPQTPAFSTEKNNINLNSSKIHSKRDPESKTGVLGGVNVVRGQVGVMSNYGTADLILAILRGLR